jgi:hypothetical protein
MRLEETCAIPRTVVESRWSPKSDCCDDCISESRANSTSCRHMVDLCMVPVQGCRLRRGTIFSQGRWQRVAIGRSGARDCELARPELRARFHRASTQSFGRCGAHSAQAHSAVAIFRSAASDRCYVFAHHRSMVSRGRPGYSHRLEHGHQLRHRRRSLLVLVALAQSWPALLNCVGPSGKQGFLWSDGERSIIASFPKGGTFTSTVGQHGAPSL